MPTIQLVLDRETSARLAFLAELKRKRKVDIAIDLLKGAVFQQYNEMVDTKAMLKMPPQTPSARRGTRGQPILYNGSDPRLQNGKIYTSFAEVLRVVRQDLEPLLYNAKRHTGDKAENILKHYEPGVYKDLSRISNNDKK